MSKDGNNITKSWRLAYRRKAVRYLARLPVHVRERILAALESLSLDPAGDGLDVKRLQSRPGLRPRVGGWRVLMELAADEELIVVLDVRPRGDAYKG